MGGVLRVFANPKLTAAQMAEKLAWGVGQGFGHSKVSAVHVLEDTDLGQGLHHVVVGLQVVTSTGQEVSMVLPYDFQKTKRAWEVRRSYDPQQVTPASLAQARTWRCS